MYGLESIVANNGWAISVVGVSIVFTGLILLSLSISRIHKFLALWDNRNDIRIFRKESLNRSESVLPSFTEKQKMSARQFRLLIKTMSDPFSLQWLLHLAEISGFEHPHSSLCHIIKAGIIQPDHQGKYYFNRETFDRFVS